MNVDNKICSICQRQYTGFGNNAWPVNGGRCCDVCNSMVVSGARVNRSVTLEVGKCLTFDHADKSVLKDIVLTIPENERPRMLGIMIDDLDDSASTGSIPILLALAADLYIYDGDTETRDEPSAAANEGYLRVADKITEICGTKFDTKTYVEWLRWSRV